MVMGLLVLPASASNTVFDYQYDFSAANPGLPMIQTIAPAINGTAGTRIWTAGDNGHVANGTEIGLLGPFADTTPFEFVGGNEMQYARGVRITLGTAGGTEFNFVTISFQLWVLNTWDGNDGNPALGPDFFQVGISSNVNGSFIAPTSACGTGAGNASLSCETYSNLGNTPGSATPTFQVSGEGRGSFSSTIANNGYSLYDINLTNVPVTSVNGQMTAFLIGWQNQGAFDESWAISNLRIAGFEDENGGSNGDPVIPEPSTIVMAGLGLAFLAFARKSRKAKA
jgi:hypothetical protein